MSLPKASTRRRSDADAIGAARTWGAARFSSKWRGGSFGDDRRTPFHGRIGTLQEGRTALSNRIGNTWTQVAMSRPRLGSLARFHEKKSAPTLGLLATLARS